MRDYLNLKNGAVVIGASILAGMIMGAFGFVFYSLGWMGSSGMEMNASMVLSPEQMQTAWMPVVGMLVHMVFSAGFGVAFYIGVQIWRRLGLPGSWLLLGLLFGVAIFVLNAGIMAPLMGLHKPFWQMPLLPFLTYLSVRLIYGGLLAVFLKRWAYQPAKA